ncbi:hypothetical protein BJG92_02829 [Arthrobacter sp. SO5]|uniref:DUF7793 family protein n=1 Tax=Arthrobacter sp. SO5 TaxID=1897055 RepID=UPI001E4B15B9|nr:STAS/SEC14 domain-containing protein [Arthrobacter sp. SO5]MCB5275281.1 hypothetical protein [Arthrobacter sp. SO5]
MEHIELAGGKATLADGPHGVLRLACKPGSILDADDARTVVVEVQRLSGNTLRPLLVEITHVSMSSGARRILLETRFVAAVALVGLTVVDRVLAAALQRERSCPQHYFTSVPEAMEWLQRLPSPGGTASSAPAQY